MNEILGQHSSSLGKLLIVDDDPAMLRLIDRLVENHYGPAVERYVASDPIEAEQVIRHELIDVVVTDLSMGEISGIRLVNWLNEWEPLIQVIVITAYDSADALRSARAGGASDFIVKPFSRLELLKSIDFHLRRARRWDPLLVPKGIASPVG